MKSNGKFIRILSSIPIGVVSIVILAAIFILTLMPSDDVPSVSLPHIDKVVHFLMFGALSSVILYDVSRHTCRFSWFMWFAIAVSASFVGGAIELLQQGMALGRGAEWSDFLADTAGAFIVSLCFIPLITRLVNHYKLNFVTLSKSSLLNRSLIDLYTQSFPPEERRHVEGLKQLIDENKLFHFSLIRSRNRTVGFITWWNLSGDIYVEHFAIYPQMRSKGLGELTMERFCAIHSNKGVVLEVERPGSNSMADRRIGFYRRCGFKTRAEIDYIQPPYAPGLDSVPLLLMTHGDVKDLPELVAEIHRFVYNQ